MLGADERQGVLQAFLASGRLSSARMLGSGELAWGKSHSIVAAVEGTVDLGGREVMLRVGVCSRFPLVLPHVFAALPDAAGTIPHLERDGRICYRSDEGLLIDHHAPIQVLEEAFDAAVDTLAEGLSGESGQDFVDELEAYWRQLADRARPASYVEPDDRLRPIEVVRPRRGKLELVADSFDSVRAFWSEDRKPPPLRKAAYVPLQESVLEERFTPRMFEDLEWTRSFVLRHLAEENRDALARLRVRDSGAALVVLGVPRRKGGRGLVGLEYHDVTGGHPFHRGTSPHPPRFVAFERRDRAVAMARADGAPDLRKKHVVIAGCGAVGGHLALLIARTGVGRLTLIDPDSLAVENTFRHALGRGALHARKVHALKREIAGKIPYIEIDVHDRRIEDVLQNGSVDLDKTDLLVYAAGDPTVGLHVNERIHGTASGPALLFTWLEPYGLGGHALLTHTRDASARGCFGCLFDSPIGEEQRRNRADFAGPGQRFTKDVSGCATIYTPYADLDAVRTAELAARLGLAFLRGSSVGHPLLSWKGDGEAFRAAGFRPSARYEQTERDLQEQRFSYAREGCTVCGGRP